LESEIDHGSRISNAGTGRTTFTVSVAHRLA
jgi:hypothetical protein